MVFLFTKMALQQLKIFFPYADQGKTKTGGWLSRRDDRGIIGLFSPLYDNQWNTDLSELAQLYAIAIRAKELNKKDCIPL